MSIHSSHDIIPSTVRGPFPEGEGPDDYATCQHCDGNLTEPCESTSWETDEVMRWIDNHEDTYSLTASAYGWRTIVRTRFSTNPDFQVNLDLVDWPYIEQHYKEHNE